jgi:urease accessory protein
MCTLLFNGWSPLEVRFHPRAKAIWVFALASIIKRTVSNSHILIVCESVIGNIGREFKDKYDEMLAKGAVEKMVISRSESERLRMRKSTDKGTDVALAMQAGTRLRHGDVVYLANNMIVINIEPERVAVVRLRDSEARTAVLVGHAIGNLHRPIKVEGSRIILPIQSDNEIEMLRRQLGPVSSNVEIMQDMMVFEQESGAHEH